ncbi:MAG: M1 family metallopeptidase [Candidatus Paceibacterota bacterium]
MQIEHSQDPHSFYEPSQPKTTKLSWDITRLDIEAKELHGTATWEFDTSGETYFDTRALTILDIKDSSGNTIPFEVGTPEKVRGQRLSFVVPSDRVVIISYHTDPAASGLQWMDAALAGGQPLIYTQGEAINARSYIPCQDTPSIKFTTTYSVRVPQTVRGLMAAAEHVGRSEADNDGFCVETWNMPYPIPAYLIAFAVGNLESRDLSDRSRVWALPNMVDACAAEFKDIEKLMLIGEGLFGPYPFGRQDFLVLPPAFPYGGMENPCLSFLTPALIAGDGSGIGTLIHEMAHAWTGNLITNADWDAFWLNEGWTVWAEQRIMEVYRGRDEALLHYKLLEREFEIDCAAYQKSNELDFTKLSPAADNVDPDDIFSRVPYFKGSMLLMCIEEQVGRERFATFVASYINTFKFQSIYTETFLNFVIQELGQDVFDTVRVREWVYESGLPTNAPKIDSQRITEVQNAANTSQIPTHNHGWGTIELQLWLELLPRETLTADFMARTDAAFDLRYEPNIEVRWSFLVAAVEAGYDEVLPDVLAFLCSQGRMKYLKPLYRALAETPKGKEFALEVFAQAKDGYHPVAISMIENVLK